MIRPPEAVRLVAHDVAVGVVVEDDPHGVDAVLDGSRKLLRVEEEPPSPEMLTTALSGCATFAPRAVGQA